jgi:predicted homoserine dehydrogenase-like protein
MSAQKSLALGALPIGLAHSARLTRSIAAGEIVRWEDCALDVASLGVRIRHGMETMFGGAIRSGSLSKEKML